MIQWNTLVTSVRHNPASKGPEDHWAVEVEHNGERRTEYVSHVIVSNGHYNEPFVPSVPGLDTFKGTLIHSRWWRNAAMFRGKNVIVVGSRASGFDIARELAQDDYNARLEGHPNPDRKIYQSVRGLVEEPDWDTDFPWSGEITVVSQIVRCEGDTFELLDGKQISADVVVYATGYLYSYPFFNGAPFLKYPVTKSLAPAEPGLPAAGGQTITNLTPDDVFYAPDPTLAFIGLRELERVGQADPRLHGQPPPAGRDDGAPDSMGVHARRGAAPPAADSHDRLPGRYQGRLSRRVRQSG